MKKNQSLKKLKKQKKLKKLLYIQMKMDTWVKNYILNFFF